MAKTRPGMHLFQDSPPPPEGTAGPMLGPGIAGGWLNTPTAIAPVSTRDLYLSACVTVSEPLLSTPTIPLPHTQDQTSGEGRKAGHSAAPPLPTSELLTPFQEDALSLEEALPPTNIFIPCTPAGEWGRPDAVLSPAPELRRPCSRLWSVAGLGLGLLLTAVAAASTLVLF